MSDRPESRTQRFYVIEYVRREASTSAPGAAWVRVIFDHRPSDSKVLELLGIELRRALIKEQGRWATTASAFELDELEPTRRRPICDADGAALRLEFNPLQRDDSKHAQMQALIDQCWDNAVRALA